MFSNPTILLLSNRDDLTTDFIAIKLHQKNLSYVRINSEDITERGFTVVPGEKILLGCGKSYIDISTTRAVYFRRLPSVFQDGASLDGRNFINRERKEFLEGLSLSLDALWINPMQATISGERKIFQLILASKLGIRIPKTIITNEPMHVRSFMNECNNVIAKPVSHGFTIENGEAFSIYTNQLQSSSLDCLDSLIEVPTLIQENLSNGTDVRVTIVGKSIFAVAIEKEDKSIVDWRRPEVKKRYVVCELPEELKAQLLELNNKLGLVYSAIDLIQQADGNFAFLEVNPVGEWLWLELELGLKISDEIIKCLAGRN